MHQNARNLWQRHKTLPENIGQHHQDKNMTKTWRVGVAPFGPDVTPGWIDYLVFSDVCGEASSFSTKAYLSSASLKTRKRGWSSLFARRAPLMVSFVEPWVCQKALCLSGEVPRSLRHLQDPAVARYPRAFFPALLRFSEAVRQLVVAKSASVSRPPRNHDKKNIPGVLRWCEMDLFYPQVAPG